MTINDLVNEMAVPVNEGPKVWKKINDLLKAGDYAGAAKHWVDSGGSPLAIKRSWNTAIGKPKSNGKAATGPLVGTLSKEFTDDDLKKLQAAIPKEAIDKVKDAKTVSNKAKKERATKNISGAGSDEPPELSSSKAAEHASGSKEASDTVGKHTKKSAEIIGSAGQTDYLKSYGKLFNMQGEDALKQLKARSKELKLTGENFKKYADIKKKSFSSRTPEERKDFSELKRKLLTHMPADIIAKTAIYDFQNVADIKEFKSMIDFYEKDVKKPITNSKFTKTLLNKIKDISEPETQERKDLLYLTKPITGAKKGTSAKALAKKVEGTTLEGIFHLKQVDKFLDKYNSGKSIVREDLVELKDSIKKMTEKDKEGNSGPMALDKAKHPKDFGIYTQTLRKLRTFLSTESGKDNSELDIDDIEAATLSFAKYHEDLIKDVKAEAKKRSMREDIMFNLNN